MNLWILLGIFVILDLAMVTFIVVSRSGRNFSDSERRKYAGIWESILKMDERHAVMEADKVLYDLLQKKGYPGTLGEKLKKAGPMFNNINDVWSAHKLRNKIAHELGTSISKEEVKTALNHFKRAYRDLGLKL